MVINSSRFNFSELMQDAVHRYLDDYCGEVIEATTKVIPQVAKESARRLKETSPRGTTGKYASGWAYKVERGRLNVGAVVYGKHGTYQRAHLLEHGHAKRNGGRTKAIEHIKPVEEWAIKEAYDRIMDRLQGVY